MEAPRTPVGCLRYTLDALLLSPRRLALILTPSSYIHNNQAFPATLLDPILSRIVEHCGLYSFKSHLITMMFSEDALRLVPAI